MVMLPPSALSQRILESKYFKYRQDGEKETSYNDVIYRVCTALTEGITDKKHREIAFDEFTWAMKAGFVPAGRILSTVGTGAKKQTTVNCTVLGPIKDDIDDIFEKIQEAGLTLKRGAGIGLNFSTLRPSGTFVRGSFTESSGPISFMSIFDSICSVIASSGGRRGAIMAAMDIYHPDILKFIDAKKYDTSKLTGMNLSVVSTYEFEDALVNNSDFDLYYPSVKTDPEVKEQMDEIFDNYTDLPKYTHKIVKNGNKADITYQWKKWAHIKEDYHITRKYGDDEYTLCVIYKTFPAQELLRRIAEAAHKSGEPGILRLHLSNELNALNHAETFYTTNPCGEQPLAPYGSCLLGSVDLTRFVHNPFADRLGSSKTSYFDYDKFNDVCYIAHKMLDKVVDVTTTIGTEKHLEELKSKRKHGLGIMGLGSVLTMMNVKYGSKEAQEFLCQITKRLFISGVNCSLDMGDEFGDAQIFESNPEFKKTYLKNMVDRFTLNRYSNVNNKKCAERLSSEDAKVRFTHNTSIAPTGSLSLMCGDITGGIEPRFNANVSLRKVRSTDSDGNEVYKRYVSAPYETRLYIFLKTGVDICNNELSSEYIQETIDSVDISFIQDVNDISPMEHIRMQEEAQKNIDSSISKTINMPETASIEDVIKIFTYALTETEIRGLTIFRDGSREGILESNKKETKKGNS